MNSQAHALKIHPQPLADLLSGEKTSEVRSDDRGFKVGDTVRLMEVNPDTGNLTGAADHVRTISHIQRGYELPDGLCVLSYAPAPIPDAGVESWLAETPDGGSTMVISLAQHTRIVSALQASAMVVPDGWMELAKRADDFLYSLEETDAIRRLRADLCAMLAAHPAPGDSQ